MSLSVVRTCYYPVLQFGKKDPNDSDWFYFNFSPTLKSGETVLTATFIVTVISGVDGSPSSLLVGSPLTDGVTVKQRIANGVNGVKYNINVAITTSLSSSYPPLNAVLSVVNG